MTRSVAPRILKQSISSALAKATETLIALAKMIGRRASRVVSESAFEIVQTFRQVVRIEDHGGDADRPGERPAPDLVHAGDPAASPDDRLTLELEMRPAHGAGSNGPSRSRARSKA